MRERQGWRSDGEEPAMQASGAGGDAVGEARGLIESARAIIDETLSGDSEQFLRSHEQMGGQ